MKIIAIKDKATGNEAVGTMWKETKIFESTDTLKQLMDWVGTKTNCVVTIADEED